MQVIPPEFAHFRRVPIRRPLRGRPHIQKAEISPQQARGTVLLRPGRQKFAEGMPDATGIKGRIILDALGSQTPGPMTHLRGDLAGAQMPNGVIN
jgi:hypothetical protein